MTNIRTLKRINLLKGLYFHAPIMALYFLDNGVGLSHVIYSQIFYSTLSIVSELPTGMLADRWGQKFTMSVGLLCEAVGVGLMFLLPHTWGLYLAVSIRGVGGAFQSGSDEALLYESVEREDKGEFKRHYGVWQSNHRVGFVLSTLLTAVVIQRWGSSSYPWLFVATFLTMASAALWTVSLQDVTATIRQSHQSQHIWSGVKQSWALVQENKVVRLLTSIVVLMFTGHFVMQKLYQPYFVEAGVEPFFVGAVLAMGTALGAAILRHVHRLEDYLSFSQSMAVLYGAMGLLYISMFVFPHPGWLVVAYVLLQGLNYAPKPILSDYIHQHTDTSIRSTMISGISLGEQVVRLVMRVVLGTAVGIVLIGPTLALMGIYILLALVFVLWLIGRCGCMDGRENTN